MYAIFKIVPNSRIPYKSIGYLKKGWLGSIVLFLFLLHEQKKHEVQVFYQNES